MKKETVKLSIYIAKDTSQKFNRYSEMLGLTKSAFGNMCILIGISNYARMIEPEKLMTSEDWANLIRAVKLDNEGLEKMIGEYKKYEGKNNG